MRSGFASENRTVLFSDCNKTHGGRRFINRMETNT
nr:MAG TPA: hypothetical protein [Caudoviricetes sp.]